MKREERLLDAIGQVGDDLVTEAKRRKKVRNWWMAPVAAVLALVIMAWMLLPSDRGGAALTVHALAEPQYPQLLEMPDLNTLYSQGVSPEVLQQAEEAHDAWYDQHSQRREKYSTNQVDLSTYLTTAIPTLLAGEPGENQVCSPLNVYMLLAMTAELTDGASRDQILDLLNVEDLDTLRAQANTLWNAHYRTDRQETCRLASSVWLNEGSELHQGPLDALATYYYAASYEGQMGSDALNEALRDWMNEGTGNLLQDQIQDIELRPETVLALVTTIYYQSGWCDEFMDTFTEKGIFHGVQGDQECDFMNASYSSDYYWGDQFTAVPQNMDGGATMWMLLPDEGVTAEQLLRDPQAMALMTGNSDQLSSKYLMVNRSVPKFDVEAQSDLKTSLEHMGITDLFDPEKADFSPLSDRQLYATSAVHGARVSIDEEGCTGAAYSMLFIAEAAPSTDMEEVDFVLDRPFVFVITSDQDCPLFVGIVHQP